MVIQEPDEGMLEIMGWNMHPLPAPLFTVIVDPSDEAKEAGDTKKEIAAGG